MERAIISVAELDRRLRGVLERASDRDWVQGEMSGLRRAASGHVYFTLKDEREEAVIDCVMYRSTALRARRHSSEGACVQVFGRATLWAPRGRLQFVVDSVRPVGRGALLEALERLKAQLLAEGLFDAERRRPLPPDPRVIGVVTSSHGAAWRDIKAVVRRRTRATLVLAPAQVQGEGAVESMLRALDLLERDARVEVVILGRGGGSLEDLMAFNDERLVRRVATFPRPLVSAVGHETDTSLCDLAADRRAATPSEAAELVAPDREARIRQVDEQSSRLLRAMRRRLEDDRGVTSALSAKLSDPRFLIAQKQQDLDELVRYAERYLRRRLGPKRQLLRRTEQRLLVRHPRTVLWAERGKLKPLELRLVTAVERRVRDERSRLTSAERNLRSLSPLSILSRGYSIALDEAGRALLSSEHARVGQRIHLKLFRGELDADVVSIRGENQS